MKTVCLGGGPAGLYFAILTKKARPSDEVVVYERNRPGDTFGFGVVFSDRTLDGLEAADPPVHAAIERAFAHWDDIAIHAKGTVHRSTGHGFAGLSRRTLLRILEDRARELGVDLRVGVEIDGDGRDPSGVDVTAGADLVVVADGVNSAYRTAHEEAFQPSIDHRPNWFVWLGTTFPFEAFTFHFKDVELPDGAPGLFQVHAYRFEEGGSTFIVECHDDVFRRSGLAIDDEAATVAFLERAFAEELAGHGLVANRSIWRRFPVVRNGSWRAGRAVLLGDAAHTAHFSIGSGTKLALEDALALREALDAAAAPGGGIDVDAALDAYVATRRPVVDSTQRAAQVSLAWFEDTQRHLRHDPLTFAFSLLTRSLRVTHANLRLRDPAFVARVDAAFEAEAEARLGAPLPPRPDRKREPRPPMFVPFKARELVLDNRVAVSPMCMYSADDGTVDDWHLVHLGSRAVGGAGLVLAEMTDVSREGRITRGCAGMYRPDHVGAWRRITEFVHRHTRSKIGLQIGHAGRKGATKEPWHGPDVPLEDGGWPLLAASAVPWSPAHRVPRAMTRADMDEVVRDHVRAAEMAIEAGFDWLELHAAHGYLLATFLSPLTNVRDDAYGGSVEGRLRFPLEVFRAVRAAWPAERPMSVRISGADWAPGGIDPADVVAIARAFHSAGADVLDVSSAGTVVDQRPAYGRVWQLPLADLVRNEGGVPAMSVGNFSSWADVNGALAAREQTQVRARTSGIRTGCTTRPPPRATSCPGRSRMACSRTTISGSNDPASREGVRERAVRCIESHPLPGPPHVNVRPLVDEHAVLRILPAWRALFARASRPEVVTSPAWALAWWREFGRDGRRLAALAVEDAGGLVGIALLASRRVLHRRLVPLRRLELWMTGEPREHEVWSEYVGVVAERGREAEVASALAAALADGSAGGFDELSLARVSSDDPLLPHLVAALQARGFEVTTQPGAVCPYARLPRSWDEYLRSLKKGHRYAVRLSLTELEKWADGKPIDLCEATDQASAREGLEVLRRLHGARWARQRPGGVFASERFARFHRDAVPRLVDDGLVDLLWLRVGTEPVAAVYNLIVDGRSQVYQSGRIVEGVPRRLSLGTAMHARAIQRAIERGDREYDFLGGPTLYKRQLSTDARELVDVVARPPRLRGRASAAAIRAADAAIDRLRPLVARVRPAATAQPPEPAEDDDEWPGR